MVAGIVQLAATGIENTWVSENPQITFFKTVYRRHTEFATESIPLNFNSTPNFGQTVSCTLGHFGDLVSKMYLFVQLPAIPQFIDDKTGNIDERARVAWVKNLGHVLISDATIEIDGHVIDKLYGEWLHIWSEMTVGPNKRSSFNKMIGNLENLTSFTKEKPNIDMYIPLSFWFTKGSGLSIPLVALTSDDIKISIKFRSESECLLIGPTHSIQIEQDISPFEQGDYVYQTINGQTVQAYVTGFDYLNRKLYYIKLAGSNKQSIQSYQGSRDEFRSSSRLKHIYQITRLGDNPVSVFPECESIEQIECISRPKINFINCQLYVDYVYLGAEERRRFGTGTHEYLIEQTQFNKKIGITSSVTKFGLSLKHPVKTIYWVAQFSNLVGPNSLLDYFNYDSVVKSTSFMVNGVERFGRTDWLFTSMVQPLQHHTNGSTSKINMFSFSNNPELFQPTGAMNMSNIDNIQLLLTMSNLVSENNPVNIRSYAINYNILRIGFGKGSVAFK